MIDDGPAHRGNRSKSTLGLSRGHLPHTSEISARPLNPDSAVRIQNQIFCVAVLQAGQDCFTELPFELVFVPSDLLWILHMPTAMKNFAKKPKQVYITNHDRWTLIVVTDVHHENGSSKYSELAGSVKRVNFTCLIEPEMP